MSDTINIEGKTADRFGTVKDVFAKNFADGLEVGASFAVMLNGEPVVDIWGGIADPDTGRRWEQDTIVNVFSTTKAPTALAVAQLVDRGLLSYEDKVAKHWPEFGAGGKENVTVGQLMSHQAGVCGLREPITVDHYFDWDFMCERLAAMEPFWTPGDGSGYHAVTYGYLAGELIRRIDGRSPGQFIAEEVSAKAEADFHVGLDESEDARVATLVKPKKWPAPRVGDAPGPWLAAAFANPNLRPRDANTRAWRAAEIPSANGHSNARALVRIFGPLAQGGGNLISRDALGKATAQQCFAKDRNLGFEMSWGAGFMRNRGIYGPNPETFGHSGWGGSMVFADPDKGLAVAYAMNQMDVNLQGDSRTMRLIEAVYSCL